MRPRINECVPCYSKCQRPEVIKISDISCLKTSDDGQVRHAPGTQARLAFALFLYAGQRKGDVTKLGRQHIKDGVLSLRQSKTGWSSISRFTAP